jgi:hypothetical protein
VSSALHSAETTAFLTRSAQDDFLHLGLGKRSFWCDFIQKPNVKQWLLWFIKNPSEIDAVIDHKVYTWCEEIRTNRFSWGVKTYNAAEQYVLFMALKKFFMMNIERLQVRLSGCHTGTWYCVKPTFDDLTCIDDFLLAYADCKEDGQAHGGL